MSTDEPGPKPSSPPPEPALAHASHAPEPGRAGSVPTSEPPVSDSIAPQDTREPAYPGTITESDVQHLESLLMNHGRRVRELEQQQRATRRLVRDLGEQLSCAAHADGGGQVSALRHQRDAAATRALEAEAARAELIFRLDEVLGHLAEAARASGESRGATAPTAALPVAAAPEKEASLDDGRKQGEIRGLRARVAEQEEALGASQARVMLLEDDLVGMRDHVRSLERELSEQAERLEFEVARASGAHRQPSVGRAAESADLELLRTERSRLVGEVQGLSLRVREAEDALASQQAATAAADGQLARLRSEHTELAERTAVRRAEADRAGELMGTVVRLESERSALIDERDQRRERDRQLDDELRQLRDELAAAQAALAEAAIARDAAQLAREQLADEARVARDAARQAAVASDVRAAEASRAIAQTLADTRESLVEIGRAIFDTTTGVQTGGRGFTSVTGASSPSPAGPVSEVPTPANAEGVTGESAPDDPEGATRDRTRDLENALAALEAERVAHLATSSSTSRKMQQFQEEAAQNAHSIETLRGRFRKLAATAEALRAKVPANDRLAPLVAELIDLTRD